MITVIAFIVGALAGGVTMYFVLKNNKKFLNASLAKLAAAALEKATGPTAPTSPASKKP